VISTNDALRRADLPEMRCETAQRPLTHRAARFLLAALVLWLLSDCQCAHLAINQALRALQLGKAIIKEKGR
jgi:hypothetical protein